MATEESKKMKKSPLFVLGLLVLLCAGVFLVMRLAENGEPPDTFSAADMEATNVVIRTRIAKSGRTSDEPLRAVRNDCGACGTSSPIGGWETEDGRMLVLDADYTFFATDGPTSTSGEWERTTRELCLITEELRRCFAYEQNIDAMRLDEAIYTRR